MMRSIFKKQNLLFFICFAFLINSLGQTDSLHHHRHSSTHLQKSSVAGLEIPAHSSKEQIIKHTGFTLSYNETHEQANWVAYQLTKEETDKIFKRTNKFLQDPKVRTGSAADEDYKNSGYDRGHLAPAADMGWSAKTMAESFYYSNMSPQLPSFNRGIWKKLEELVREWAVENESIYIVTGPVLKKGLNTIGQNQVSVPEYYYKVILDYTEPEIKGIGFIMSNTPSKEALSSFAVSIDHIESLTGIDLFPLLEDEEEAEIESSLCIPCWSWEAVKTEKQKVQKSGESVQCNGTTKAGNRCRNRTLNENGYCYHHRGQGIE